MGPTFCLPASAAARDVTASSAGTTQLKIEQLCHRQLPSAAAIGYLPCRSATAILARQTNRANWRQF